MQICFRKTSIIHTYMSGEVLQTELSVFFLNVVSV